MIIFKYSLFRNMKYHVTKDTKSLCGNLKLDTFVANLTSRECNEDELYLLDEMGVMCRSCVRIALKEKKNG